MRKPDAGDVSNYHFQPELERALRLVHWQECECQWKNQRIYFKDGKCAALERRLRVGVALTMDEC